MVLDLYVTLYIPHFLWFSKSLLKSTNLNSCLVCYSEYLILVDDQHFILYGIHAGMMILGLTRATGTTFLLCCQSKLYLVVLTSFGNLYVAIVHALFDPHSRLFCLQN